MFIEYFSSNVAVLVAVLRKFVFASANTNEYWWPEAESNCRPLVFQTEANHLSFHHFKLIIINYRSFVRGSRAQ